MKKKREVKKPSNAVLMHAYCWRSGLLEIGETIPEAALHLASAPADKLREVCGALARWGQGKSDGKMLVPGVPEAETEMEALAAVRAFRKRINTSLEVSRYE